MNPSAARVEQAMSEAMRLIADLPDGDERLKHDSLEGETRFFAVLDDLAEEAVAATRLIEMARERIKRLEARAEARRTILRRMLTVVDLPKCERPLYTASISRRQELTEVATNEALPATFVRSAPDKVLIAKTLRRGEEVPGYALADKDDLTITLRTA